MSLINHHLQHAELERPDTQTWMTTTLTTSKRHVDECLAAKDRLAKRQTAMAEHLREAGIDYEDLDNC